jgi:HEAT repeat protein
MRTMVLILALAAAAFAQQDRERDRREERAYSQGQRAISRNNWDEAISSFESVIAEKGSRADGALYWKAYAQLKAGKRAEALATVAQLRKEHASSPYLNDARILEVEVKAASGQAPSPESAADDELRLYAINALQHQDPDRVAPLLEKIIQTKSDSKLRERALFVLAQSNSQRSREILAGIAKGGANPDLQLKAIEYLGVHGSAANKQLLEEIYRTSPNLAVKRRVINSFGISGDRARLLQLAKSESNAVLRAEAINGLGVAGGRAELHELYASESTVENKRAIMNALFVSGDVEKLSDLAKKEQDPALRRFAINQLGVMGRRTADTLSAMYTTETDRAIKREILNALFVQNNAKAVIAIARAEKDLGLRKEAVEKLSQMNSPEATEFLMELLNK